ncbi:hypothetical protein C0989_010969 [Termitomyces sp. Mn162]|nr:hypothetical protein C0989_010969 [Termitomyces sp. Mn162]
MDGFINNIIRTLTAMPPTNNTDDIPLPTPHDEPMDTDHIHHDADGVPELQPMADSSDDGVDHNSDEEEDEEEEVVMQTVNDDGGEDIPPLEPIQSNRNRRPRVEDDEDSERDRRHPSQRINQPLDVTTAAAQDQDPNPPFLNGPTNAGLAIPIFPRLPDAAPQGQANQNQPNQNQNQQQQRQPLVNGFAITVDINGQRVVRPLPGGFTLDPANGAAGAGFADFLTFLSALSEHETDDPERAKRLVDALEEVPVGLVRRLEALSGKTSSGDGQGMGAGDCSCAICWDTLLDGEGGFGVEGEGNNHQEQSMEGLEGQQQSEALEEQQQPQSTDEQDASTSTPSSSTAPPHAQDPASPPTQDPAPSPTQDPAPPPAQDPAPPPPTSSNLVSSTDPTQPKIVSLPCAHVFHAACLIPWFSRPRQTTCPTCRFNIDPERLTARRQSPVYSFEARRSGARGQGQAQGGEQQQQEDGAAGTVPVGDGQGAATNADANAPPDAAQAATQPQAQPQPANAGQRPAHGPGAILTIGFDIVIGPNPHMGAHANANATNANPAPNPNGAAVDDNVDAENTAQNTTQNQNQNVNPTFNMGPMNMGFNMGGMDMNLGPGMNMNMAGMGMAMGAMGMDMDMDMGMDEGDEIEEVTMMDMNDADARELGEILRGALPPHAPHAHTHAPAPPHHPHFHAPQPHAPHHPQPPHHAAPPRPHTAPPAPASTHNPGVDVSVGPAQPQQRQGPQQGQPMMGVFTGTAAGRTMGEAFAALFSQPLQPLQPQQGQRMGQAQPGAGIQLPGGQAEGQQDGAGQGQQQGWNVGEGHHHQRQQAGQGQIPDATAFRNFLSALFFTMAQGQARGTGAGQAQWRGANNNINMQAQAAQEQEPGEMGGQHDHSQDQEHTQEENQNEPQPQSHPPPNPPNQPQNAASPGTDSVLAPLPQGLPAGAPGAMLPFNLGNLLGLAFGGVNVDGGEGGSGGDGSGSGMDQNANNGTNDGGSGNGNQPTANANAHGPAMNIPFVPFASLFPGATLTPPPPPGTAQPVQVPAQQTTQPEQQRPADTQEQVEQQPQVQPDDDPLLSMFTRLFPGPDAFAPQNLNTPHGAQQQQPQPQQAPPLPPWARLFQPPPPLNLFNPGPAPAGAAQPQAQQGQGQPQQPQQPQLNHQLPIPGLARLYPPYPSRAPREKKPWTLPPPPGPTLRQRIEKREREAGFRCYDVSCGVGPSDEDPFVGAGLTEGARRQLSICVRGADGQEEKGEVVCEHTFHPACLVSAARVANALGEDGGEGKGEGGLVDVSCSVCKGVGGVRRGDWDEGVRALA